MKIAVPVANGRLAEHFGHCEQFAIFDADIDSKEIKSQQLVTPPPHEPGILPRWLHEMGVNTIISSGMGQRAQQLFNQNKIEVVVGAAVDSPENIISSYLNNELQAGENICDH